MFFLLVLKQNLYEQEFFCVKTKPNKHFAAKLEKTERSNHSLSAFLIYHLLKTSALLIEL